MITNKSPKIPDFCEFCQNLRNRKCPKNQQLRAKIEKLLKKLQKSDIMFAQIKRTLL